MNAEAADLASPTLRAAPAYVPHQVFLVGDAFAVGGPFKWAGEYYFEWSQIQQVLVPPLLILIQVGLATTIAKMLLNNTVTNYQNHKIL